MALVNKEPGTDVGSVYDVEGVDVVVEAQQGGGLDEFGIGNRAGVEVTASTRNLLPDEVDWVSTCSRCAQISRLNGTAKSTKEAEVAPDPASVRIDLARANLYEATFEPRRTTLRKSSDGVVTDPTSTTVVNVGDNRRYVGTTPPASPSACTPVA